MPGQVYKHIETGELYVHIHDFGSFKVFKGVVDKGAILYVAPDFLRYYEAVERH